MRIRNPGSRVEKIWIRDPEWKKFESVKLPLVRKYCNDQLRIQAASPTLSVAPLDPTPSQSTYWYSFPLPSHSRLRFYFA